MKKWDQTYGVGEGDWIVYDPLSGHVWPITDEYRQLHYEPAPHA